MNIEGNKRFVLPPNHIGMQVQKAKDNAASVFFNDIDPIFNENIMANMTKFSQFIEKDLSVFDGMYENMPKDDRITKIMVDVNKKPAEEILSRLPEADRNQYLDLRKGWDQTRKDFDNATKLNPKFKKSFNFLDSIKNQYSAFVDKGRPDASKVTDPHPSNTRILAAQVQAGVAESPNPEISEIDRTTQKYSDSLRTEPSVDKAMDKVSNNADVFYNSITNMPSIQKPVSTNRENSNAWKKADNDNPNVKRIVMFNVTEDKSDIGGFQKDADAIKKNFYVSNGKNDANPFENRFRVDKIIDVTPPTKEEEAQGITQSDKIKRGFEQCKQFEEEQKELTRQKAIAEGKDPEAAVKALRFEGMANWFGHGSTIAEKSPNKDDPRYYQEGSAEFKFISDPEKKESISETKIKQWERDNIKDFSYFTQYFNSCHSGAITN